MQSKKGYRTWVIIGAILIFLVILILLSTTILLIYNYIVTHTLETTRLILALGSIIFDCVILYIYLFKIIIKVEIYDEKVILRSIFMLYEFDFIDTKQEINKKLLAILKSNKKRLIIIKAFYKIEDIEYLQKIIPA